MTAFPNNTAKTNCCTLTFDNPATMLIIEEGENGKQSKKNNGVKPFLSTHVVIFSTLLSAFILRKNGLLPNFLMSKKTTIIPIHVPIQDNKNPLTKP